MTVKELIEKLSLYPDDAIVYTEGCDCEGKAGTLEWFSEKENMVIVTRAQ